MKERGESSYGEDEHRPVPHKGGDREGKGETLFQLLQAMDVKDRIHLAMRGSKEARALLIRDSSRAVQLAVLENPRISDGEIATIASSRNVDDDVLRAISSRRGWVKLYAVRLALAKNPRTPLPISLKLVTTLMRQDLKIIACSKSVPAAVAQAAKKLVAQKD